MTRPPTPSAHTTVTTSPAVTAKQTPSHPLALRAKEAAEALGIGERLLWSHTNQGLIPHLRIGTRVLYPVAELERWLSEQAAKGMRK